MKVKLAVALAVLFVAGVTRADTIDSVSIAPTNVGYPVSISLSFDTDLTTQTVYDVVLSVEGNYPIFSNVPTAVEFLDGGIAVLNFMDAAGDLLQVDVFDVQAPPIGSTGPGTYLAPLDIFCAGGDSPSCISGYGNSLAVVTDPPAPHTPEPSSLLLSAIGMAALIGVRRLR